jgi:hypothetical protein
MRGRIVFDAESRSLLAVHRLPPRISFARRISGTAPRHGQLGSFPCLALNPEQSSNPSANFTEAAQRKNIEASVLIRYEPFVTRLSAYFEALRNTGQLLCCPSLV